MEELNARIEVYQCSPVPKASAMHGGGRSSSCFASCGGAISHCCGGGDVCALPLWHYQGLLPLLPFLNYAIVFMPPSSLKSGGVTGSELNLPYMVFVSIQVQKQLGLVLPRKAVSNIWLIPGKRR